MESAGDEVISDRCRAPSVVLPRLGLRRICLDRSLVASREHGGVRNSRGLTDSVDGTNEAKLTGLQFPGSHCVDGANAAKLTALQFFQGRDEYCKILIISN